MYLGSMLQSTYPHLRWEQSLSNKRDMNYGQPILIGFGRVALNPVQVIISAAYGIAAGKRGPERLIALWDYWSKLAAAQ
jgi:hypothetical protein